MFIRYAPLLCIVVLFFVAAECSPADDAVDGLGLAARIVAKIISHLFVNGAAKCLAEAADDCKSFWKEPSRAISCAKDFLNDNKGRCAIN